MKAITRSYLVELYFGTSAPGVGANFNFQDFPELRDVYITGVQVCSNTYITTAPSGRTVIAAADLPGLVLNLVDVNTNIRIYNYPTFDLQPDNANGFYRDFVPFKLNLVKSYITVLQNIGIVANESLCFNFFYIRSADYEKQQSTRR
jgi:hypothetical protein